MTTKTTSLVHEDNHLLLENHRSLIYICITSSLESICSVAVPPTLHVIFILTATPQFLLVAVAIGLEYNVRTAVSRGGGCRAAIVEVNCCRRSSTVCVESRIEQLSSVCCYSYYVESDNDAVDRRRSHFVIVRLEVVQG